MTDAVTTVAVLTEQDQKLIGEGQELVQRMDSAQLKIGRLALTFAPMGEAGFRSGAGERVEIYADALMLQASTLKTYRSTAHAWSVTDVGDSEFSFALLQALVSVGRKEELLARLRATDPPSGRPRWGAQEALDFAQAEGFLTRQFQRGGGSSQGSVPATTHERRARRGTTVATPRDKNLRDIGDALRRMSLKKVDPKSREALDPLLAKIEGEAARLRAELSEVKA